MPLLKAALEQGLPGAAGADYPATRAACAAAWADAIAAYAAGIVPPSTTLSAAAEQLEAGLLAAFSSAAAAPGMGAALQAFAATLALGMAPGFVATPPPAPPDFATLFALPHPSTRQEGIARVATLLDVWMRTGLAMPAGPPTTPVPWS